MDRPLRGWRRWLPTFTLLGAVVLVVLALLAHVMLRALTPREGDWSLRAGPWQRELSVPVLLRWGSHPLVLPLLNGRQLRSSAGRWRIKVEDGQLHAECAPCALRLPALGPAPLVLHRVQVHALRAEPEAWRGVIELAPRAGTGTDTGHAAVSMAWHASLKADGLVWRASLEPTAIAALLDALAEPSPGFQPQVQGRFGLVASGLFNQDGFTRLKLKPTLEALHVSGLGTEALLSAAAPARCAPVRARIDGWLPRAVIAAEDRRFYEHAGFDLEETLAAWTSNLRRADAHQMDAGPHGLRGPRGLRGASTITQQLAKLIYTGDERSATRKLHEWLYAVEMERTLGKGRILQLYLAMAPWGGTTCGAEAAARRYFGKPATRLTAQEAAWLASLLPRPDAAHALLPVSAHHAAARMAP